MMESREETPWRRLTVSGLRIRWKDPRFGGCRITRRVDGRRPKSCVELAARLIFDQSVIGASSVLRGFLQRFKREPARILQTPFTRDWLNRIADTLQQDVII